MLTSNKVCNELAGVIRLLVLNEAKIIFDTELLSALSLCQAARGGRIEADIPAAQKKVLYDLNHMARCCAQVPCTGDKKKWS